MRGRTDHRVRGSQLRLSYAFVTVRIIIVKYVVVHKNEKTPKVWSQFAFASRAA